MSPVLYMRNLVNLRSVHTRSISVERGAAVAGGSEDAGESLRRAAFGPKIPPSGDAKLPPISGPKSSLRTENLPPLFRNVTLVGFCSDDH